MPFVVFSPSGSISHTCILTYDNLCPSLVTSLIHIGDYTPSDFLAPMLSPGDIHIPNLLSDSYFLYPGDSFFLFFSQVTSVLPALPETCKFSPSDLFSPFLPY